MFRVQHALIFSSAIEVLMPERLEESRGLTVPRVGLLGGTFIPLFLSLSAILKSAAFSFNWANQDHARATDFILGYDSMYCKYFVLLCCDLGGTVKKSIFFLCKAHIWITVEMTNSVPEKHKPIDFFCPFSSLSDCAKVLIYLVVHRLDRMSLLVGYSHGATS